jgi:hypothetical protein
VFADSTSFLHARENRVQLAGLLCTENATPGADARVVPESMRFLIHDADVHLTSVQIDSAVVFGGGRVILHTCNTSWLMGAMRHPLIMFYAGGAGNTPRPICSDDIK